MQKLSDTFIMYYNVLYIWLFPEYFGKKFLETLAELIIIYIL